LWRYVLNIYINEKMDFFRYCAIDYMDCNK